MIYLNNAATTWPKPDIVANSVYNCICNIPQEEERYGRVFDSVKSVSWARNKVKEFFNIQNSNNIVFNSGATEGINSILFGLDIKDCHILTSVTEHNSVLRPLYMLSSNNKITFIDCDDFGFIDINSIEKKILHNTKILIMSIASNVSGAIQDFDKIYNNCIKNSIIPIFDASQAGGCVVLDIGKYNKAFWVFAGHKSLFGISGSGFIYIPDNIELKLYKTGGTGVLSELKKMPKRLPLRYEAGTKNIPGIISIGSGIEFIQNIGIKNIESKKQKLLKILFDELSQNSNVKIYSAPADKNAGVFSFSMDNYTSEDLSDILYESFEIITRSGLHCSPEIHKKFGTFENGLVRLSLSWFNEVGEISQLISAVNKISGVKMND
ncbi:MAG: aminotransferase class V-fold PLP-dependent enzyme [Candidatus Muirbacterium halophilum]|nr:aminotransferase class V-fold PLP-dependent enzyme [Candidatus Muirbacterium halophilum]MCK9476487.1 aminotransferase class V-fold PLP-dependent enzyme [Candidatus Muirbacterium halophilum]